MNAIPLTPAASRSAASRSPIFDSSETLNGSSATGVSYVPWAAGRSSSWTRWRRAVAEARAIRTAWAATRSTSSAASLGRLLAYAPLGAACLIFALGLWLTGQAIGVGPTF